MVVETREEVTAHIVAATAQATAKAVSEAAVVAAVIVAKETSSSMAAIAVLQAKVEILNSQQVSFELEINRKLDNFSKTFKDVFDKLDIIVQGRPTWGTMILMTGLSSLCVGLIVYIASYVK